MTITFITTNDGKYKIAQEVLGKYGVDVLQKELYLPEIQSDKVEDVASYAAKYAAQKLKESVFVTDVGYYIEALNGFPGPFVKHINQWLSGEDFIKLMEGKSNRKVKIMEKPTRM